MEGSASSADASALAYRSNDRFGETEGQLDYWDQG
jgi:hypothetical protein